jgi:hypothetical protein
VGGELEEIGDIGQGLEWHLTRDTTQQLGCQWKAKVFTLLKINSPTGCWRKRMCRRKRKRCNIIGTLLCMEFWWKAYSVRMNESLSRLIIR